VKVKLELGSNEAIKQAIAGGLGISVLSLHTLIPDSSEFSILDVQYFPIQRTWYMVHPSGKQLSIVGRTYFDYLLSAAKKFIDENAPVAWGTFEQKKELGIGNGEWGDGEVGR
jgi:DNA-binding transcriptional LysR family regulator